MTDIRRVGGHYEVYIDGEFYCTCDTYHEAQEEAQEVESEDTVL